MPLIAPKPTSTRPLPPDGMHVARCYSMIDLGTHETTGAFGTKRQRKIRLSFELPTELCVFSEEKGEQPFTIHQTFTFSMHEKAALRKFLTTWRGKAFTDEEANAFDVAKLLNVPAYINIVHQERGDKTYANIANANKLPKGTTCPERINEAVEFSLDTYDEEIYAGFPEWLQKEIADSEEYRAMMARSKSPSQASASGKPSTDEDEADIPF